VTGYRMIRFAGNLERSGYSEPQASIQIRMVAGFVEVLERKEILVTGLQPSELFSPAFWCGTDPAGSVAGTAKGNGDRRVIPSN